MKMLISTVIAVSVTVAGFAIAQKAKDAEKENHEHAEDEGHEHGDQKGHEHGDEKGDEHGDEKGHEHGSEKGHEHGEEKGHEHGEEKGHEHGDEEGHEHGGEDGHGHEERSNVGPDKGVTEASESTGFKLRDGVEELFEIKRAPFSEKMKSSFQRSSVVYSKEEYQVFRLRNGFWKAVDVQLMQKGSALGISSNDLKDGDQIAIEGVGYLKIIEQSVFGPVIEGHIH